MQIYDYFPEMDQSLVDSPLNALRKHYAKNKVTELDAKIECVRIAALTAADAALHGATGFVKTIAACVQIPLYPIWEGIAPDLAFVEAGGHTARAIRSGLAAMIVPVAAMASPEFAFATYDWLALSSTPLDSLMAKVAARVKRLTRTLTRHPIFFSTLALGALALGAFKGYQFVTRVPEVPVPTRSPWLIPLAVTGGGVVLASGIALAKYKSAEIKNLFKNLKVF